MATFGGDNIALELEQLWTARANQTFWLNEFDTRTQVWDEWHTRISNADGIIRGDWPYIDPATGEKLYEAPMVANIAQLALEDRAASASSIMPSVRCPIRRHNGAASAEKRERIAASYLEANGFQTIMPTAHMDYLLCGVNFKGVFPDFVEKRPRVRIFDPRTCFPNRRFRPDRKMDNLLVAYEEALSVLMDEYPDAAWPTFEGQDPNWLNQLVTCLEWFDNVEFLRYAIFPYNNQRIGLQLTPRIPNVLGEVPISLSVRPTSDRQFRGVYDQTLYPLLAENRITKNIIDHAEDYLESPMVEYDIANPDAVGEVYHAKSPQGFIRRMPPDGPSSVIFGIEAQLRGNSRISAVYPEARSAIVDQNIASGAFVGAIQASFNTAVGQDRAIEARSWSEVLRFCFATDEHFFSGKKWMSGVRDGVPFDEQYDPAEDIAGDYAARMEYPLAGATQFEADIRLVQASSGPGIDKIISKRKARVLSSFVENALEEENQIVREFLMGAGLGYVAAAASGNGGTTVPNFGPAAALIRELKKPDADMMKILESFEHIQVAPAAPPKQEQVPDALTQASGLARGGVPAPQTNIPGVAAPTAGLLPSLEELSA